MLLIVQSPHGPSPFHLNNSVGVSRARYHSGTVLSFTMAVAAITRVCEYTISISSSITIQAQARMSQPTAQHNEKGHTSGDSIRWSDLTPSKHEHTCISNIYTVQDVVCRFFESIRSTLQCSNVFGMSRTNLCGVLGFMCGELYFNKLLRVCQIN